VIVKSQNGFTLLEVMVALAIIAAVTLTLLGAVNYHLGIVSDERDSTAFTILARSRIAELVQQGSLQQRSEGTFAPSHPELAWRTELLPTQLPELKKLVLRVHRTGDKREVTLVRYVLR
jgi:type II secretion system protein I